MRLTQCQSCAAIGRRSADKKFAARPRRGTPHLSWLAAMFARALCKDESNNFLAAVEIRHGHADVMGGVSWTVMPSTSEFPLFELRAIIIRIPRLVFRIHIGHCTVDDEHTLVYRTKGCLNWTTTHLLSAGFSSAATVL